MNNTEPCDFCKANDKPNCGNEWCHTKEVDEKEWVTDCNFCGSKTLVTWKQAIDDGCQVCCSRNTSIYHRKNL